MIRDNTADKHTPFSCGLLFALILGRESVVILDGVEVVGEEEGGGIGDCAFWFAPVSPQVLTWPGDQQSTMRLAAGVRSTRLRV